MRKFSAMPMRTSRIVLRFVFAFVFMIVSCRLPGHDAGRGAEQDRVRGCACFAAKITSVWSSTVAIDDQGAGHISHPQAHLKVRERGLVVGRGAPERRVL